MADFSLTITIERQPAVAFAVIADPTNMTQWYDAVDQVTISQRDPVGLGARFEITRSLPGGRAINEVEITQYEPSWRITFESRQGPTPFRYSYTLEPLAERTLLTLNGRISSAGLAGPAAHLGAVATQLFKRGMKHNLEILKDLVEAQPAKRSSREARDR